MLSPKWHFRRMRPADIASDPDFARALFSGEAARSLVRESIQNSLDARASDDNPVAVRFALRSGPLAAPATAAAPFTKGIWEHLVSPTSGLAHPPSRGGGIPFLVVEDFGTRGLTGDPEGWDPFALGRNSFFLFFRALGRSGKKDEERGRWGVGKFVFPLASQGHCLFGYTIPADTRKPLLMGRTVLRTHQADGMAFHPDGQWGNRDGNDALVVPETDEVVLHEFRQLFGVSRLNQPGLSVIVPWLSVALDGRAIIEAVVAEYFLPILRSELIVEVDDNGNIEVINAESIVQLADRLPSGDLRARIHLALEAATWPVDDMVILSAVGLHGDTDWSVLVSEERKSHLLKTLDEGRPVAIRVPVSVRPKDRPTASSYFDVFIQRSDGIGRSRPLIVREGITIAEDKTQAVQDHVALIVVDHGALATFVGDAETPAHTTLQPELVADRYTLAGKLLKILRSSVAEILRALEQAAEADDFALLADFFPISINDGPGHQRTGRSRGSGSVLAPVPPIPATPPRYRLTQVEDGFRVKGTGDGELPTMLTIRFAYEVRRGNPFKRYNPLDFSLLRRDLTIEADGVRIVDKSHNALIVQPIAAGFALGVSGFDRLRDLVVRVDAPASESSQ